MARITGEILIDRPAGEVFDFVSDERNEPRYNRAILSVEKVPDDRSAAALSSVASRMRGRKVRTSPLRVVVGGLTGQFSNLREEVERLFATVRE